MLTSGEVLRVLGLFGVVEWARISLGPDPVDNLPRPPLIVWRYADLSFGDAKIEPIRRIVAEFNGLERWSYGLHGRNLVIVPEWLGAQFRSTAESDATIMARVKISNPDFCVRANADLAKMFQEIEVTAR